MSVSDTTVFILIAVLVNYLIVYTKNRLVGNIVFMVIGIGIWSQLISADGWIGMVLFFTGLISTIYDAVTGAEGKR